MDPGNLRVCYTTPGPSHPVLPSVFQSHGQGREGYFPKPSSGTSQASALQASQRQRKGLGPLSLPPPNPLVI